MCICMCMKEIGSEREIIRGHLGKNWLIFILKMVALGAKSLLNLKSLNIIWNLRPCMFLLIYNWFVRCYNVYEFAYHINENKNYKTLNICVSLLLKEYCRILEECERWTDNKSKQSFIFTGSSFWIHNITFLRPWNDKKWTMDGSVW